MLYLNLLSLQYIRKRMVPQYFYKHKKPSIQKMQYSYFQCLFAIEINTIFAIFTLGLQKQNWTKGM
jgi:hypothetical protein